MRVFSTVTSLCQGMTGATTANPPPVTLSTLKDVQVQHQNSLSLVYSAINLPMPDPIVCQPWARHLQQREELGLALLTVRRRGGGALSQVPENVFTCWPIYQVINLFFFLKIYLFIHERHRERERGRDTGRGRSRSMQGARCGTRFWVSRITPWAESGAKWLSHQCCPQVINLSKDWFAKHTKLSIYY